MPFVQRIISPRFISRSQYNNKSSLTSKNSEKPRKFESKNTDSNLKEYTYASPVDSSSRIVISNARNATQPHIIDHENESPNNGKTCLTINQRSVSNSCSGDRFELSLESIDISFPIPTNVALSTLSNFANVDQGPTENNDSNHTQSPLPYKLSTKAIDSEFESITNTTLSNVLRQLASLVVNANDIFLNLNTELQNVGDRSKVVKLKLHALDKKVNCFDPKLVLVPEGNLDTFAQKTKHYQSVHRIQKNLFTSETRPKAVHSLYEEAAKIPTDAFILYNSEVVSMDTIKPVCSSPLVKSNKKNAKSIEIRMPAAIEHLRKWTSSEALGDVTVTPDCVNRVNSPISTSTCERSLLGSELSPSESSQFVISTVINGTSEFCYELFPDVPLNHRLPSPEEQSQIIASKYPVELISVDTSGFYFKHMCMARKSIIGDSNNLNADINTVKRRVKSRKVRGKRRNTIAGIDNKELQNAANGNYCRTSIQIPLERHEEISRSCSSHITKNICFGVKQPHFNTLNSLKQWSRNRLKLIMRNDIELKQKSYEQCINENINDNVTKSCNTFSKTLKSQTSGVSSVVCKQSPTFLENVKLRESALSRHRRNAFAFRREDPHSSSGNWSASSESGRTSNGSEITIQPRSSTSITSLNKSIVTASCLSSSFIDRKRFLYTSEPSSITSEGTITPELSTNELGIDDETSSAYSCDTEGYYTSFHIDSGLRTLKEEEPIVSFHVNCGHSRNHSFSSVTDRTLPSDGSEYEIFDRGSTSTTTSSIGTVITACPRVIKKPEVPYRISSVQNTLKSNYTITPELKETCGTIASTIETANSNAMEYSEKVHHHNPSLKNNELEGSENSDFETVEQIERLNKKIGMKVTRIPSMCIISPSTSDDENIRANLTGKIIENENGSLLTMSKTEIVDQFKIQNEQDKDNQNLPNSLKFEDESMHDQSGEYVTIADISNKINNYNSVKITSEMLHQESQYVSLNELPRNICSEDTKNTFATDGKSSLGKIDTLGALADGPTLYSSYIYSPSTSNKYNVHLKKKSQVNSARVKINALGRFIYDSDSLKRRKRSNTTFSPGPYVKTTGNENYLLPKENICSSSVKPSSSPQADLSEDRQCSLNLKADFERNLSKQTASKRPLIGSQSSPNCSNSRSEDKFNMSPITPRDKGVFHTSTPTKADASFISNWQNTCSDRIGASKTTLMDFKKLLLAKSTKTNPTTKLSAVEILKQDREKGTTTKVESPQRLSSDMTIFELSKSPRTFANRRMLRQGQFGSPSPFLMTKQRTGSWKMKTTTTDVISETIAEVNSEEDHISSSGSSQEDSKSTFGESQKDKWDRSINLKQNIFLQIEENNFMKGELTYLNSHKEHSKSLYRTEKCPSKISKFDRADTDKASQIEADGESKKVAKSFPALETAL